MRFEASGLEPGALSKALGLGRTCQNLAASEMKAPSGYVSRVLNQNLDLDKFYTVLPIRTCKTLTPKPHILCKGPVDLLDKLGGLPARPVSIAEPLGASEL